MVLPPVPMKPSGSYMKDGELPTECIILGTNNAGFAGRSEGDYPNAGFTWERKDR